MRRDGPPVVSDNPLPNGARVSTLSIGAKYVSRVTVDGVVVARAENTEAFHAGVAHGVYLTTYATMPRAALDAAVEEARAEDARTP